jgi:FkbM family methyltransferase
LISEALKSWKYYRRFLGTSGALSAAKGKIRNKPELFRVESREIGSPIYLRVPSSDVGVYSQVFLKHEYKFEVNYAPESIVDAGANIGLTSVYLANRFPNARIFAIEPESTNFEILVKNTAPYPNILPIHAALWGESTEINVMDPGLGNWGFMTEAQNGNAISSKPLGQKVQGLTINAILEKYGIERLSILKIDIEGAEMEVFRNSSSWINRIDSLIVELHEHMKSGCNRSFYSATDGFDIEWTQGELVYLTRTQGCLQRPLEAGRSIEISMKQS